jgi:hypothetical protein
MIEMHRHEALVQSFIRWMADSPEDVPEQFQDRVSAYVGPICWAFMQEAPTKNSIPETDLTAGISRISAMTRADIPGIDQVREDRVEAEFQTQKTLALLRLHYCWDPGKENSWSNAWNYNKNTVAPLVKACAWRGPLTDFLTEHHLRDRHVYNYDHTILFKMAAHVWKIDDWEVYQAYRYLPDVERLADIADAESRREEAWRLYEKWGTPRIGLQIARVLSQAGDAQEAALFERHVIAYVNGLSSLPYRSFDGIFAQALEFNTVPGYEDRVIGYAGKLPRPFHYLANIRLAEADALERQGDLEEALVALAKDGIVRAPDNQWLYVGEGRYHGSGEALDAILRSIAEHPNATPKTFALMESMFPQRVADALDGAQ